MLSNRSDAAVEWVAEPDVTWLQVEPADGTLDPGATAALRVGVTSAAPEGPARGAVRISATHGSATVVRLSTTVERPPELAATATGCDISVTVEDEGEVRAVELHWIEGAAGERVVALPLGDAGYTGRLANSLTPVVWWVTASDGRGQRRPHARRERRARHLPLNAALGATSSGCRTDRAQTQEG